MPESTAKILITGATGGIGHSLVDRLATGRTPFVVLCRRDDQAADFAARGIDAVLGNLDDAASIRRALDGCDQLFLLPPSDSPPGVQFQRDVTAIDAAAGAGIRHVLKISASDANPRSSVPWARDHGRSDEYLTRSGLAYTRLHPPAFMTNLLPMAPLIRRGLLPNSSGHGACTWVDPDDVAAAAHAVLLDENRQGGAGAAGRCHLLTGTQPLSFPQIAAIMTTTLRRRIRPVPVPAPLLYTGMRLGRAPHWQARGMVAQLHDVVRRGLDGVRVHSTDLAQLLTRPPVGMADFIAANAARFSS